MQETLKGTSRAKSGEVTVKLASERTARRDARFGIRRGGKDAKGQQSLESAATLTLGSMFLARFSTNLHRKIDLTNAFKTFFSRRFFLSYAAKSLDSLGFLGGARTPARAPPRVAHTSEKLRTTRFGTCRVPYHEALVRASSKDLAQGQVALLDPT